MLAMKPSSHLPALPRKPRTDGVDARERLLNIALRLFAEKGFAKTSTREIAQGAGANIASISYYFGDKAGLYRAVFTETKGCPSDAVADYDQPYLSLRESLHGLFANLLAPMKQGDLMQLCTRLHFREMLEPTGVWAEKIDSGIKPAHAGLIRVLCRHLGVTKADDDLHRLAFSVTGLALQIFITRDVIDAIRPKLLATPRSLDAWTARLVDFAEAMVAQEAVRRNASVTLNQKKAP
jgi:AcrR family transcriptional regulator